MMIHALSTGSFYTSGVFLVAFVEYFQEGVFYGFLLQQFSCGTRSFRSGSKVGYGIAQTSSVIGLSHYFEKRYATANGIMFSGAAVGMLCIPPLHQIVITIYGWRSALFIVAGVNAHICLFGTILRPLQLSTENVEVSNSNEVEAVQTNDAKQVIKRNSQAEQQIPEETGLLDMYNLLAILSTFYGLHLGIFQVLVPVALRECVGVDNLHIAFGWDYFSMSIGFLVGPTFVGPIVSQPSSVFYFGVPHNSYQNMVSG
uniref:Monocarboxylate transporter 12-B-like n=1 Tax=Saccoglossus kowalevskii TaxID=10224 RepID=A0ABM0MHF4_SACKO|nr:PREDICTED: monocarboxylate transporter 12-B-like [Saccoglossus kowalevskii]